MANGTVYRPLQIFRKDFSDVSVSLSSGTNALEDLDIRVIGYTPICGKITGGSTVALRNDAALLGFNSNNYIMIFSKNNNVITGTMSFMIVYVKNDSVITLT